MSVPKIFAASIFFYISFWTLNLALFAIKNLSITSLGVLGPPFKTDSGPPVSPQVIQPIQTTMQTGLTPTETALLSEEEKAIRLRQRGMA